MILIIFGEKRMQELISIVAEEMFKQIKKHERKYHLKEILKE